MAESREQIKQIEEILFYLTSSSESDEEEEIAAVLKNQEEVPKIKNFIENVVHKFSEIEFQRNFRLTRQTAYWLIAEFEASSFLPKDLKHGGKTPISAEKHILSFLWFAGNKCSLRDVAQRFGVSVSSLHSSTDKVISLLIKMAPTIIKMPVTEDEKNTIASEFKNISGFPNIIGCIDGTAINIRTPAHKIKSTYVNRHDMPSITLQGICDHERKFIDVFTGVPGKVHDARVFKLSDISIKLPTTCGNKYHVIGDNAYPIRKHLLTPYKDYGNLSEAQTNYNKRFSTCRVRIENSFGLLKGRFRQLQHLDMNTVLRITRFILSCCVLHNICIMKKDFIDPQEINQEEETVEPIIGEVDTEVQLRREGERKRDAIKNSLEYL